jgi:hypothetical protein
MCVTLYPIFLTLTRESFILQIQRALVIDAQSVKIHTHIYKEFGQKSDTCDTRRVFFI